MNRREFIGGCAALGVGAVVQKYDHAEPIVMNDGAKELFTRIIPLSPDPWKLIEAIVERQSFRTGLLPWNTGEKA